MADNIIKFVTADGSTSYRNIAFDEMYHTKSGAREEAFEKHARPLRCWEKEDPIIYDVCFGLGYNAAAAIDIIREKGNNSLITIYCFENDAEIIEKILEIEENFRCFGIIKEFAKGFLEKRSDHECYDKEWNVRLIMLFGDARERISEAKDDADFIFFDPFSPRHHPEMWTADFLTKVYGKTAQGGKLTTYSYARRVREGLALAGYKVIDGPIIGRISPSTIAIKEK